MPDRTSASVDCYRRWSPGGSRARTIGGCSSRCGKTSCTASGIRNAGAPRTAIALSDLASAQQIGAGLIGLVTLSARAKALSTFWSRRIFYADVDETYRLYLRALATGDVESLRWRASTPFMRSLTDRVARQRPGYRIVGPIIHEEHSVKPRIVHTMPTSGQFQVTVRFRTTQARRRHRRPV